MHPIFHFKFFEMPAYGSVIALGLIIGVLVSLTLAKIYDFTKQDVLLSTIIASMGMIIFAKIFYVITLIPGIIKHFDIVRKNIMAVLIILGSGYVFYGGLIGALLGYKLYCKIFKLDTLKLLNVIVPCVPLVHAFGRIGCFLGGCCYGIEYHGPFAIHFPPNIFVEELNLVPRFPVQPLEAILNFILFIILYLIARKKREDGLLLGLYLIIYPIIRFSLEFLRGDGIRGKIFGISTSQYISIVLFFIGIYFIIRAKNKNQKSDVMH